MSDQTRHVERDVKPARNQPRILPAADGPRRHPLPRDPIPKQIMELVGNGSSSQQALSRFSNPHLAAVLGANNLAAVATPDAMLVTLRRHSDNVKRIVTRPEGAPRAQTTDRQCVQRPWGYFTSLDTGERFQVKCIVVNPGGRLSLQKHFHRSEHWVVVCGTAEVTVDDKMMKLYENELVYVPVGAIHRLANPGKIPLKVIEVQSGSYLGEDDIVRFEDDYHRARGACADDASYCDASRPL